MTADWTAQAETLLKGIWTPELDALFWRSDRGEVESAWYGHVPFAHWIVRALEPRSIVELGSHNGVSYSAFCRAVQREGLGTRCLAVDTWAGDDHAGFYGEDVFNGFRAYHDERFAAFSSLVRRTFDDALELVPEGSVDLLHIDGRHGYEDVRHDFESWRPKISDRGIVLFHDTNVRDSGFGVWRLWTELRREFAGFEFLHAFGLGVLAVGTECPPLAVALTQLRDAHVIGTVRERFAQLGDRHVLNAQAKLLGQMEGEHAGQNQAMAVRLTAAEQAKAQAEGNLWQAKVAEVLGRERLAQAQAAATQAGRERLEALQREEWQRSLAEAERALAEAARSETGRALDEVARAHNEVARARTEAALARADTAAVQSACHAATKHLATVEAERDRILLSSTWRATWPLRRGMSLLPCGVRRLAGGAARAAWHMLTPHRQRLRQVGPGTLPVIATSMPTLFAPTSLPAPVTSASAAAPVARAPVAVPGPLICYVSGEPDTPGTTYRVERHAAAAAAAGARVTMLHLVDLAAHMEQARRVNVLVLWRTIWTDALAAFIGAARARGARIVFDVDDLMIDPALATIAIIDGIRSQNTTEAAVQAHYTQVQRTMLAADYCTASTMELAGHMRRFGKACVTLPNGFDAQTFQTSRMAARQKAADPGDGLLRLGYAGGSRTHQRDFAELASALPAVFRAHPDCRLILFQTDTGEKLVDLREFADLAPYGDRIEWRNMVPLTELPNELARFDVNLVPLQLGNPFCEAKSELKYFEGALAGVCSVASPVGPYARVIQHGSNGFLAATQAEWQAAITRLLGDPDLRRRVARVALDDVLWEYGPERRTQLMRRMLAAWRGGPAAADAFALETDRRLAPPRAAPNIPAGTVVFSVDHLRLSEVTVAIPLYNYAGTIIETLNSVRVQSLQDLDLVIVDDGSSDQSLSLAVDWARTYAERFNRVVVLSNQQNAGLGPTRNAAFSAAETPYVLPLDADNLLRPGCCELLLAGLKQSGGAFAYPVIQEFGARTGLIGVVPYDPQRLVGGNYIDAMALVAKSAWSAVGGYASLRLGWEDYDFWCAIAETGLYGYALGGPPQADYRAHDASMLAQVTDVASTKDRVISAIEQRHPWVSVARPLPPVSKFETLGRHP